MNTLVISNLKLIFNLKLMSEQKLVSVSYWNYFIRFCEEEGEDLFHQLPEKLRNLGRKDQEDYVYLTSIIELIQWMRTHLKHPHIGIGVGELMTVASHGSLGYVVSNVKNLKECLDLCIKYQQTRIQIADIQGREDGGFYYLQVSPSCSWEPVERDLYEVILKSLVSIVEFCLGKKISLCRLQLPFDQVSSIEIFESAFACPFEFSQPCGQVVIPLELLQQPCVVSNPKAVDLGVGLCDMELKRLEQFDTLSERIVALIENSERFDISINTAAQQLNMSKSTLIRKLREEDASFKAILEEHKKQRAIQLLSDTQLTIEEISFKLGYQDTSNFGRSFKRWLQCSPSSYRTQLKQ